jgi:hypothetical protein
MRPSATKSDSASLEMDLLSRLDKKKHHQRVVDDSIGPYMHFTSR